MPGRRFNFVTDEIYHICSRGIDHRKTFRNGSEYERALLTLEYYRPVAPTLRLSIFLASLTPEEQQKVLVSARSQVQAVEFLSFCLMPNHLHFIVRQKSTGGVTKFMSNFHNSYTRFFNLKSERVGPLFLNQFRAVRIADEDQFLHTVRYVLLNPYSSGVVSSLKNLEKYKWSALPEYLGLTDHKICLKGAIADHFKDQKDFRDFLFDRADYQRNLEEIKHLILE